jgi:hypothetical protein
MRLPRRGADFLSADQDDPEPDLWPNFVKRCQLHGYRQHLRRTVDEPFAMFLPA